LTATLDQPKVHVRGEPLTYERTAPHSFFVDLGLARMGDDGALGRLERHQQEMVVETRANPSTTLGLGGEFAPPLWLIERFKTAARTGRPLGDLLNPLPLPPGVQSINIPKISTGFATNTQAGQGEAVQEQDATSAALTSQVVTIAGEADVSQQLYDLTPSPTFDVVAYTDLIRDYDKQLENQLITGTGANGTVLGLASFTYASGNSIDGSGTAADQTHTNTFLTLMARAAAVVGNNGVTVPEVWLMAPRRWFWLASSYDSQQRPLDSPTGTSFHVSRSSDVQPAGGHMPFGPLFGLPIYVDPAIPAGSSADNVYTLRPSDMFLWESDVKFSVFSQPLSGPLETRLRLYRYVAFIGNIYSTRGAVITGIPQPTNY
jgi:HK97 family phage major capsid protein